MQRSADPYQKVSDDADTFYVALFTKTEYPITADSSSIGWAVATKISERKYQGPAKQGADVFKVVLEAEYMKKLQDWKSPILSSPYLETCSNVTEEYKKGRLLKSLSHPIHPCVGASRPQWLFRAVHDDHPGDGLQSRGFGSVKCDSVSFMLHFDYHLNWKRRNLSPFMSASSNCAKAANIAAKYERQGFNGVKVLLIKVDECEWQRESTIWHVGQTARELNLIHVLLKPYFDEDKYLIKDEIPESCVARVGWKEMKAGIKADKYNTGQSRKRKRGVYEYDDVEEEPILSDGRSWGNFGLEEHNGRYRWRP